MTATPRLLTRKEALERRALRGAWLLVALGLVIPFFALWAAARGWSARAGHPRQAWVLIVVGVAAFTVRAALYVL